jgi:abortive infection bacteriophage resistance protein
MQLYSKTHKTPEQLIALLKERGLTIINESYAKESISNIGYYRFSAYLHPLLLSPKDQHIFKPNTQFETARMLYQFDSALRILLFEAIAKIEIAIRSAMANIVAQETGNIFWITDKRLYADSTCFEKTLSIIKHEFGHSKEDFIEHFKMKYSNPFPPAWILVEILPKGTLDYIYRNLKDNTLRKKIASQFALSVPVFSSWTTIITLTRNACCHHARIWNKENAILPIEPRSITRPWINPKISRRRIFYNICIIKWFIDIIEPDNNFKGKLSKLIDSYPIVDTRAMGFPNDWKEII